MKLGHYESLTTLDGLKSAPGVFFSPSPYHTAQHSFDIQHIFCYHYGPTIKISSGYTFTVHSGPSSYHFLSKQHALLFPPSTFLEAEQCDRCVLDSVLIPGPMTTHVLVAAHDSQNVLLDDAIIFSKRRFLFNTTACQARTIVTVL